MNKTKEPWFAHVTVATVVEKEGLYLLVEEIDQGKTVYNQPAGHLDEGESLIDAAIRETMEESAWEVEPYAILGLGQYLAPNGATYFRTTFLAKAIKHYPESKLDDDIIRAVWMSYEEVSEKKDLLRSPMVLNDIELHRSGLRYPLELYQEHR